MRGAKELASPFLAALLFSIFLQGIAHLHAPCLQTVKTSGLVGSLSTQALSPGCSHPAPGSPAPLSHLALPEEFLANSWLLPPSCDPQIHTSTGGTTALEEAATRGVLWLKGRSGRGGLGPSPLRAGGRWWQLRQVPAALSKLPSKPALLQTLTHPEAQTREVHGDLGTCLRTPIPCMARNDQSGGITLGYSRLSTNFWADMGVRVA